MRKLYIFNYQREIPPFMQMEIGVAKDYFDEIYYITRKLLNDNRNTIDYANVHIVEIPTFIRYSNILISPIKALFDKNILEIARNPKLALLKRYFKEYFCAFGLYRTAKVEWKKISKGSDEIYAMSAWMGTEATAVAQIKKHFPWIKAYSFAHSFEVIPERNPYLKQSLHEFHHKWLDKVYFISANVLSQYLEGMSDENIRERYSDKIGVRYIGCNKSKDVLNPENKDSCFRIVTCSRIDENKRLGRIVEALSQWKGKKIHWAVIGDGSKRQEVEEAACRLVKENPQVEISFLGQMANSEVQIYYQNNPVDLFINVSRSEGLPVSIMEAISYGIPILATDVGGTAEIVTENSGMLLTPDFSDEEFLKKLGTFAEMDFKELQKLRAKAVQLWNDKFNIKQTSAQMYAEWFKN